MNTTGITRRRLAGVIAATAALRSTSRAADAPNPLIVKAMKGVTEAIPRAEADADRPVYHFRPPAQWNNDPNGTIFYKGWHHLFYQLNPYDSKWGHMHWGHARSRDLVNWEHLPIALWPSLEKGEEHVFSGSAIAGPDGKPIILYTSIGKRDPEQWLATPLDDELIRWRKSPKNPIATVKLHGGETVHEWRDPFMFRDAGKLYMVCGGNSTGWGRSGGAAVYLYQALAEDGSEWKYLGRVFEYRDRQYNNIECPNLFRVGGKWVLLLSPHRPTEYFTGDLDIANCRFTPQMHGYLDPGDSYASNISYDDTGRCILWLWGRTDTPSGKGWNSVMTLPRILSVESDGTLRQTPPAEFEKLRGDAVTVAPMTLERNSRTPLAVSGDCLEIEAEFTVERASKLGLRLRCDGSGKAGAVVAYGTQGLGAYSSGGAFAIGQASAILGRQRRVKMRIFLDKCVVEAYANNGEVAVYDKLTAGPKELGVEVFAEGGAARLESFKAWPMKAAAFSLEHFKV